MQTSRALLLAAGLALLAALPYLLGGVGSSFTALDDDRYVYDNPQVRRGLTPATALWALRSAEDANWYPLRRLSHLVDVSLFGLDARGHRWVSVGWHAAAALLLFAALHRMSGRRGRSFLVAAVFAAHPVQVESVAWVAERSNVQAGFFFALTLLLWARHVRRPGPGRYAAAAAACALGLAAKPVLVTLPLLLLLLDLWPLGRIALPRPGGAPGRPFLATLRPCLLEKLPLLLLAAASGAMAVVAHLRTDSLAAVEALPLGIRLLNAAVSCWRYVGKLLWPADLAVFYPHPGRDLALLPALAAALLAAAATTLALTCHRRRPWLAAGWLWFALTLAPMSGVVQFGAHAMADRFLYLPAIGLFLGLVWLAAESIPPRWRASPAPALAAAALLAALVATSAVQAGYWKESETLFRRALAVTEENWVIRNNLAALLARGGRHAEAVEQAREAVRLRPGFASARVNLGGSLAALGRHEEAAGHFRAALVGDPANAEAGYNLGNSLRALGRHEEAIAVYREALRLRPGYARARAMLGNSLAALGREEEAIASFRETLRGEPDLPEVWLNLGLVLASRGRTAEAAASIREALERRPGYPAARAALDRLERGAPR